ncbi:MAG: OprD family outer membrane porin [Cyclobacteriaceae bacterium]|nr:OprD family outer membrane porin [Cyclobacteriaceae bacterium]
MGICFVVALWMPVSLFASTHSDSTARSFSKFLSDGKFEIHTRSFFMATINKGDLLDYSTLAIGGGLGYVSPVFKGFQLGMSGFFVFQIFENNVTIRDPLTNGVNRYELLLYDMNDPSNTRDLDRLEELYIRYNRKKTRITFGRQKVMSPLLNEQDNRMRPNIFSGLRLEQQMGNWQLGAAWFTAATLRGTVDWYNIENSYGVYPFGRNESGLPSEYKGNISSRGLGFTSLNYRKDNVNFQNWTYLAENVFALNFSQLDYEHALEGFSLVGGLQGFYQQAAGNGGNPERNKAYINPEEQSSGAGMRLGIKYHRHSVHFNGLNISSRGRFLFPREWGRETFYVSLPRERHEGLGGMSAASLQYINELQPEVLKFWLGAGIVRNPSVESFRLNKYGVPSYYHFVGVVDYSPVGFLEGMDFKLMIVNKTARDRHNIENIYRINRVDMWNFNFVMDYRF